jgi:hypothetical protein
MHNLPVGCISTFSLFENNHLPINDTEPYDPAIHLLGRGSYPEMARIASTSDYTLTSEKKSIYMREILHIG